MKGIFDEFMRGKLSCRSESLLAAYREIDLSTLKVFDFGWLVNTMFEEDTSTLAAAVEEAKLDFVAGVFRLPFPNCVFCWHERNDDGTLGDIILFLREREEDGIYSVALLELTRCREITPIWMMLPVIASVYPLDSNANEVSLSFPRDIDLTGIEHCMTALQKSGGNMQGLATLLARPGSIINKAVQTPAQKRLRRQRGLVALPEINHIVHLNRVAIVRATTPATASTQSAAKRPHDRRSHQRTLADGRVVSVRSCKIKGGANGFIDYEVLP